MPFATVPGSVRLNYEICGREDAPRLLVLNPSNTTLAELRAHIAGPGSPVKLDHSFRCLFVDYRGLGESTKPGAEGVPPWPSPNVEVYADDILELLHQIP